MKGDPHGDSPFFVALAVQQLKNWIDNGQMRASSSGQILMAHKAGELETVIASLNDLQER